MPARWLPDGLMATLGGEPLSGRVVKVTEGTVSGLVPLRGCGAVVYRGVSATGVPQFP